MLIPIIFATTIVGLVALIGVILIYKKEISPSLIKALIGLSAGALLTVALLDLLPEAIEGGGFEPHTIFKVVLLSFLFFFLFEKVLHWHHCHCGDCDRTHLRNKKHIAIINLTGDAIHNMVDGFLIAGAFLIDFNVGIITTLAVIMHEIPQEITDFGVLLYAGFSKTKALIYNFVIALTAVLGAILFFFFGGQFEFLVPLIVAFAAGNFLYLAAADLIPELHHETNPKKIVAHSIWLLVGVLIMFGIGQILPHGHGNNDNHDQQTEQINQ